MDKYHGLGNTGLHRRLLDRDEEVASLKALLYDRNERIVELEGAITCANYDQENLREALANVKERLAHYE